MLSSITHVTILSVVICVMKEIKRTKRLSQALVRLMTARASLFTEHRMLGLPIRAKYKHF